MKITISKIEKVPRKNLYKIYSDDLILATVNDFSVVNLGIKVGKEFDSDDFEQKISETKKGEAFETLLNILGQTSVTEYTAKLKLRQKGFEDDAVDYAVQKAVDYNYINDKNFAETYIEYTSGKSKKRIKAELSAKGISESVYYEKLNDYDEFEACNEYMRKIVKCELDDVTKRKIFTRAYMQGFPYDVIKATYEYIIENL